MSSNKSLKTKVKLAKAAKQNGRVPPFTRLMTRSTVKWNYKRRHWRRGKLNL